MRISSRLFPFPDVNVWLALTFRGHIHHVAANKWLASIPDDLELCFCRFTQISLLRLLTTDAVMKDNVLSQQGAWRVYDAWLENGRAIFLEEPPSVEILFRSLSQSLQRSPKDWADSYLSAFAQVSGIELVTFDQSLHRRTAGSLLLKA